MHRLRLDRQSGCLPSFPAADQRARFAPSGFSKLSRHTGAFRFVGSSAKGEEPSLARHVEVLDTVDRAIRRDSNRPLREEVASSETAFGAHIENEIRRTGLLDSAHLRDGDEIGALVCARCWS